jgi:hypothetical protein
MQPKQNSVKMKRKQKNRKKQLQNLLKINVLADP